MVSSQWWWSLWGAEAGVSVVQQLVSCISLWILDWLLPVFWCLPLWDEVFFFWSWLWKWTGLQQCARHHLMTVLPHFSNAWLGWWWVKFFRSLYNQLLVCLLNEVEKRRLLKYLVLELAQLSCQWNFNYSVVQMPSISSPAEKCKQSSLWILESGSYVWEYIGDWSQTCGSRLSGHHHFLSFT